MMRLMLARGVFMALDRCAIGGLVGRGWGGGGRGEVLEAVRAVRQTGGRVLEAPQHARHRDPECRFIKCETYSGSSVVAAPSPVTPRRPQYGRACSKGRTGTSPVRSAARAPTGRFRFYSRPKFDLSDAF
ncbi:hypothetical protein E2C01_076127 [Portunus trituberculatus]|uniref:Secreted protein n=1 Tax=Portunus trituberculatus TaxID=210409 RepID=A0A5B7IHI7_PORTR|nr:hypothetical protein [Portunus trituberculatus]